MHAFVTLRLRAMMFMQFFVWGAWYATGGNYMANIGMSEVIYIAYMASPIGSIVAPFFTGMIADRYFAIQKVLGVMHLLSGTFLFCAPFFAEGALASTPVFITFLFVHMLCYMPTLGLATATAFHLLPDKERDFPLVRVFGTVGWIAAGFLVSYVYQGDATSLPMHAAGIGGVLLGLYSFTLPDVPPPAAGKSVSFRDIVGVDAIIQLKSKSFFVFLGAILLTSIPLATYYAYAPVFIMDAGVENPAFKMTFGQMSEALCLLALPWFLVRFGIKWVMVLGMSAWVVRYALFAGAAVNSVAGMIIVAILLHGICYDFVYIAAQIYIDKKAPREIRAQAQGLFVLVSYGVGQGLGTLVMGWIFNAMVLSDGTMTLELWQTFWIIPVVFAGIVTVVFTAFFKEERGKEAEAIPALS